MNNPYILALLGTGLMFLATTVGSAIVFFVKKINIKFQKISFGFASGIMMAASVWSLLIPAITLAEEQSNIPAFIPACVGLLLGVFVLLLMEKIIEKKASKSLNFTKNKKRSLLLFSAVTLHNIPEGMAVALTFALACMGEPNVTIAGAFALAVGMSFQNIPEGSALSLPLRQDGMSKKKSFLIGSLSGIVEPISAVITVLIVGTISVILPFLLSFAAGAMIFVIITELLPESHSEGNRTTCVLSFTAGFLLMMLLDVALG